jgi:4-hydroxybenzoate polyprenyltransferase
MLSQLLVRYCLVLPAFRTEYFITGTFPKYLSDLNFFLLVISTVLIAAAGYVINDYFDVAIDQVNKPGKNIVGKSISKEKARTIYFMLSFIGVALGFYVAFKVSKPVVGFIPLFASISLWMYSSYYKRSLLIGNFIVSILSALSLLIVGLYEPEYYKNIVYLMWFSICAFLLSMVREIIKDMEDIDGDRSYGSRTLPIAWGLKASKLIASVFIILLSAYITYIIYNYFYTNTVVNFWYLLGMFLIPILALLYLVASAGVKKDFHYASLYSKVLMLGGILSIYFFWFYFLT